MGHEDDSIASAKDGDVEDTPYDVIVWAMVTIWMYLIPNLFAKYGEYILAIKRSTAWGTSSNRLQEATVNVKHSFIFHLVLGLLFYLGYGITVALLTKTMDRRAGLISVGFSRLFAGIMLCVLSINIPQFFGLYHSRNIKKNKVSCRKSVKEIRFAFGWSLWKLMSSVILYNGYFACRTGPWAVVYGLLIGFVLGSLLVYLTYVVRHNCSKAHKRIIAYILIGVLLFLSWIFIGYGTYWVSHVWWGNEDLGPNEIYIVGPVVAVWAVITLIIHGSFIQWTKKKESKGPFYCDFTSKVFDRSSMIPSSMMPTPTTPFAHRRENNQTANKREYTCLHRTHNDKILESLANGTKTVSPSQPLLASILKTTAQRDSYGVSGTVGHNMTSEEINMTNHYN
ncbi:hypothetical protein FRACYDRAFT_256190 [Fragilariopsis cylindrus CCMP1102]|uniref:Uncharacterized protein n=1 Tax=Fragilariopsis cylindrus CCMP1102 TaxID=635003 RepID=A0A1E7EKS3_9STRA|nr:hypothetical protein FRACYDRAFT_256190 [Fragilariopsis cylindrus CCMP1102]|eukprot:OEU06153.1 hypothetical protein FRACYDRAFT_256190 [Fragilariopsis cylindrus CCMP1102]